MPPAKTIQDIKYLIENNGGTLLTGFYKNCKSRLKIICANNHIWETSYDVLRKGHWCIICAGRKLTLADAQNVAKLRNGKCFSKKYNNTLVKMKWGCEFGHKWRATFHDIKYCGSWCPICSSGLHERICRTYFESLFKKQFLKTRPKWLCTFDGKNLELDGYCSELGIAFEYNGEQHYNDVGIYNDISLNERIKTDEIKRKLCIEYGVKLIIIPYTCVNKSNLKLLEEFILDKINSFGIKFSYVDINSIKIFSSKVDEMKNIAHGRNGYFLSSGYNGSKISHEWQCFFGHKWMATPAMVKFGTWCPTCEIDNRKKRIKFNFNDIMSLANKRGGICLSTLDKYHNLSSMMMWQCHCGNVWNTKAALVWYGSWCPKCARKRKK